MFYYHQIRIYIRSLSYTQRMTHLQIALTFPIIYYSLYPLLSRLKKMYKN
ncbi:putative glycosyltransferase domain protein [Bacteroides fragilis str. 3998T(B)3]|nr:putative glycosyltransferase domain protein [Bacteroides fragilis str. 3998T(B)3]